VTTISTAFGPGEIVATERVHGRTQYKVAGAGFATWIDATELCHEAATTIDDGDVNESNSTTLPYDPSPQYPVDMWADQSTILPGDQEIDRDERLSPSDSRTFHDERPNRPWPGPDPRLFAKGGVRPRHGYYGDDGDDGWAESGNRPGHGTDDFHTYNDRGEEPFPTSFLPLDEQSHLIREHERRHHHADRGNDPAGNAWGDDDWHQGLPDVVHQAGITMYRPAGLSDKYAPIFGAAARRDDPVQRFRDDPLGEISRVGTHYARLHDDESMKRYVLLIEADKQLRTSAWADVRQKAMRLRREGKVEVHSVSKNDIYATVEGDHDTYDVMISKSGAHGGLGQQSISAWVCTCPWGSWAFKRKVSYVGRLCSHGYATYLEMQSAHLKESPEHFTGDYVLETGPGTQQRKYRSRSGAAVDDFKTYVNEDNGGHVDQPAADNFVSTPNADLDAEDVDKVFDYADDHRTEAPERDFDVPYVNDPDEVYKTAGWQHNPEGIGDPDRPGSFGAGTGGHPYGLEPDLDELEEWDEDDPHRRRHADVLRTHPQSLTPNFTFLDDEDDEDREKFVDVTKDERDTTGPDEIVHFGRLHYADDSDLFGPANTDPGLNNPTPSGGSGFADMMWPGGPIGGGTAPGGTGGGFWGDYSQGLGLPTPSATGTAPTAPAAVSPAGVGGAASTGIGGEAGAAATSGTGATSGGSTGGGGSTGWTPSSDTTAIDPGSSYTVKPGDTLSGISERAGLGGDYSQLNAPSGDPDLIRPGETIKIPGKTSAFMDALGNAYTPEPMWHIGQDDPNSPANTDPALNDPAAPAGGTTPDEADRPPAAADRNEAMGGGFDPGMIGDIISPIASGVGQLAGPIASGIGSAIGGGLSALGALHEADDTALLERLRNLAHEPLDDDLGDMDDRNDEVAHLVEELRDRGADASQLVAALHYGADDEIPPGGSFEAPGGGDWANDGFEGSGPDPKQWWGTSEDYVDKHERPDLEDVTTEGGLTKYTDEGKPQQRPRQGAIPDDLHREWFPHGYVPEEKEHRPFDTYMEGISQHPDFDEWALKEGQAEDPGVYATPAIPTDTGGSALPLSGGAGVGDYAAPPTQPATRSAGITRQRDQLAAGLLRHDQIPSLTRMGGSPEALATKADIGRPSGEGSDIVRQFQANIASTALGGDAPTGGGGDYSMADIAGRAQAFLKTAGRHFTLAEQRELESESHVLGARNLPTEDELRGTHYLG